MNKTRKTVHPRVYSEATTHGNVSFSQPRSSWNIFKVISELVESYERLDSIQPAVSIFGSARLPSTSIHYINAEKISHKLSDKGFTVITGGGHGIMAAANIGASKGKSLSIGLNIQLPFEKTPNQHQDISLYYRYFFTRKAIFVRHSMAYIIMAGGFGTLDELFDIATLVQTKKKPNMPIILFGKKFWGGLVDWINSKLIEEKVIASSDPSMLSVTDSMEEVIDIIVKSHSNAKNT